MSYYRGLIRSFVIISFFFYSLVYIIYLAELNDLSDPNLKVYRFRFYLIGYKLDFFLLTFSENVRSIWSYSNRKYWNFDWHINCCNWLLWIELKILTKINKIDWCIIGWHIYTCWVWHQLKYWIPFVIVNSYSKLRRS